MRKRLEVDASHLDGLLAAEQAALLVAMDCAPVELWQAIQEPWGEPVARGFLAAKEFYTGRKVSVKVRQA